MRNKVLVIDNDQDTLEILTFVLVEAGYEVISSLKANIVNEIKTIEPDLILLDNWLDDSIGSDICTMLKSDLSTKHIPIILMSAATGINKISKNCNADDFIDKPFDLIDLERKVLLNLQGSGSK
jgi:DNA-binding response OmpR family regulator